MALSLSAPARASSTELLAHEWGTFTSIQGSDGELLRWNGIETGELPGFVYDRSRPGLDRVETGPVAPFGKASLPALQRMETPVIYFYSERPTRVSVTVEFPHGYITEWFPLARLGGPGDRLPTPFLQQSDQRSSRSGVHTGSPFTDQFGKNPAPNSLIRWENVRVLSNGQADDSASAIPADSSGSHYFAARETDANLLRVVSAESAHRIPEFEKFLFYRGVGWFQTPLQVRMNGGRLTVTNTGPWPLRHLFAITVQHGRISFARLERLDASATHEFQELPGREDLDLEAGVDIISHQLANALAREGLFPREAEAMVKTWRSAWLTEPGTRVLSVLPRPWTDQILPIAIVPPPDALVRVMVGRAEVITPAVEARVRECIELFDNTNATRREQVVRQFQSLGLGRFGRPAIDLALRQSRDGQSVQNARGLLEAAQPGPKPRAASGTLQTSSGRPGSNGG